MTSINKREMTASISVPSRSTIVLGGLVQTDYQNLNTRVPILGSIPILGALFRSEDTTRKRTELLVLITPYVLMTPAEARQETERLHRASNVAAEDWYRGWSDSSLAPFSPTQVREMEKQEQAYRKRAKLQTAAPESAPPVALIEPAAAMPKPTPEAQDPEAFGREIERAMSGAAADEAAPAEPAAPSPLPVPEEPTATAPFTFDPAVPAAPAEKPAPKKERKTRRERPAAEEKPSMFPAPSAAPEEGGAP
jgi:general secretion pathway protein D